MQLRSLANTSNFCATVIVMQYIEELINWLRVLSETLPVWAFVLVGTVVEEVVSIIPSSLIMFVAGTLLYAQEKSTLEIIFVVLIATLAKTMFAVVFYQLAAFFEDRLSPKFLKWVGYDREIVRTRVAHFSKGKRDDIVMLLLRVLQVLPSLPVSLACGFLKLDYKTYVWTSFVGFGFKNAAQLLIGYYGLEIIAWIG